MAIMAADTGVNSRRNIHLREMGLPILFGAGVLLASATLLLFVNVTALRSSLTSIDHAQAVLTELSVLENGMLSQEMTVRGLALTGDARFIRFESQERARVGKARARLLALGSGDPERERLSRGVMQDVAAHSQFFAGLAAPGPGQAERVAKAILDPAVRENMRKARVGITQLRLRELQDLSSGQRRMADQIAQAFGMAVVIIVAAFVLGGVGIWAVRLQAPRR